MESRLLKKEYDNVNVMNKSNMGLKIYIAIACFMAIIAIIGILIFANDYSKNSEIHSMDYLTEMANKNSQIMDNILREKWQYADSMHTVIKRESIDSEKKLKTTINEVSKRIGSNNIKFFVIDSEGYYYGQDNIKGKLDSDVDKSKFQEWDGKSVVIHKVKEFNNKEYLFYIKDFEEEVNIGKGKKIVQVALAQNMEGFTSTFSMDEYAKESNLIIINKDKSILYKKDGVVNGLKKISDKSTLDMLLKNFHSHDTKQQKEFYKKIEKGDNTALLVHYLDDKSFYITNTTMDIPGWSVIQLIPKNKLTSDAKAISAFTNNIIVGIVVAMVFFVGVTVYVIVILRKFDFVISVQEETNIKLKHVVEEANAANKAKSDFLSHMSHDIRTPLNGIQGMIDIAQKNIDDKDKLMNCLYKVQMSSMYLVSLVNDVLDMSRIETGKLDIKKLPMSVENLYDQCVAIIETQAKFNNLNFIYLMENIRHPNVLGDELHLKQILVNILGNALKFSKQNGNVGFLVEETDFKDGKVYYEFTIEDNGIGMSKEFQEKIYEPFSQEEDSSRTKYKGTGLGMAIAKQCIDMMGGVIELTSELDKGSKFVVKVAFDVYEGDIDDDIYADEYDFSKVTVLVAEDNEINMEIIATILDEFGAKYITVENGKEAVTKLNTCLEGEINLVFMDIMMPVMDGYEATKLIKASEDEYIRNLPIVAMSANAYAEDVKKSFDAGMCGHLSKPIIKKEVFKALKNCIYANKSK